MLCTLPAFLLSQDQTLLDVFEKIRKTNASIYEYSLTNQNQWMSASFTERKYGKIEEYNHNIYMEQFVTISSIN